MACLFPFLRECLRPSCYHCKLPSQPMISPCRRRVFVPSSFWKTLHVPSSQALGVLDDQFQAGKVESGDGIKCDVKEDQSPLEECIDGIG